jgi:hypothetical protein
MIAAQIDSTIRDVRQSVAIGDKHIEVIKEFAYSPVLRQWDVGVDQKGRELAWNCLKIGYIDFWKKVDLLSSNSRNTIIEHILVREFKVNISTFFSKIDIKKPLFWDFWSKHFWKEH